MCDRVGRKVGDGGGVLIMQGWHEGLGGTNGIRVRVRLLQYSRCAL